jgi:hypothetical protein
MDRAIRALILELIEAHDVATSLARLLKRKFPALAPSVVSLVDYTKGFAHTVLLRL